MLREITINRDEIFRHIKLSFQLSAHIENLVNCKLITEAAAQAGITVRLEELQQAADDFRLANQLHDSDATWSWLQKHHLSLDDFEELVHMNALSGKLAQSLFGDQVEPFFYEHQLDYAGAFIYEVILQDEDLAMELFYALQEGEISFQEVARQYIQEPMLRRSGGYRGLLRRSDMKPEISAAVFAASPPQLLKPIVTSKGTYLLLVEEVVQPQLDEQLHTHILADLFSAWLKQQQEQVTLTVHIESPVTNLASLTPQSMSPVSLE